MTKYPNKEKPGCLVSLIKDGVGTRYPLEEFSMLLRNGRRLRFRGSALPKSITLDVGVSREARNVMEIVGSLGIPKKKPARSGPSNAAAIAIGVIGFLAARGFYEIVTSFANAMQ